MSPEYPYQVVTFIDKVPAIGEGVYQGENGWFPQLAIKRRFTIPNKSDAEVIELLRDFFKHISPIDVQVGELVQPESMPVRVYPIISNEQLMALHLDLIQHMGEEMQSRFPERDGDNYFPHITAEYNGQFVIDVNRYTNSTFTISQVCLIKDLDDSDSHVLSFIDLKSS